MSGWFTRPVGLACGFAVVSLLVLAGLGWATFTALEAEAGQQEATARADQARSEQLALWRLDGFMLPVVGRENARPFEDYTAATSGLPAEPLPAWVNLHLQLDPAAGWSSPQAAAGDVWISRLADLTRRLPAVEAAKLFAVSEAADPMPQPNSTPVPTAAPKPVARPSDALTAGRAANAPAGIGGAGGIGGGIGGIGGGGAGGIGGGFGGGIGGDAQMGRFGLSALPAGQPASRPAVPGLEQQLQGSAKASDGDYALREQTTRNNLSNTTPPAQMPAQPARKELFHLPLSDAPAEKADRAKDKALGLAKPDAATPPPGVHLGPMRAVWVTAAGGDLLFLVRPVQVGGRRLYQAVWLDWPPLQAALVGQVDDLLPTPNVRPTTPHTARERAMTTLPAYLEAGPLPPIGGWSPLRTGLTLAWAATLLALTAVAAGGRAVVALADRRVRFVSAVTHELRTPLTSLRLYLDLLAGGLVTEEVKRQEYLVTLSGEADRLHRLIENVLDFARLERQSVRANCVPTPAADLLAEVTAVWADRLAADGKELVVNSTLLPDQTLRTDPRMAGQVLANLVDNARKYSREAADPRVWVWARPGPRGRVAFEVEDRGPGVPERDRAGLFKAFRRGRDVEAVAGGAGLGLALAAQWAGLLGGTLTYRPADGGTGACFRLELPTAGC